MKPNIFLILILFSLGLFANDFKNSFESCTKLRKSERLECYEELAKENNYKVPNEMIDFISLIKIYSKNEKQPYSIDWKRGANLNSAISWKHEGTIFANSSEEKWGFLKREGDVILSIKGKPTHTLLKKHEEVGTWHISLHGANVGIYTIFIDSIVNAQELEGFSSVFKQFIIDKDVCIDGIVANSYDIYTLKLPKKQVLWLSEERSCGSAGCHYVYQLLYEEPNKNNIECSEWKKEISDELKR